MTDTASAFAVRERLQKILAARGIASRRAAEGLITAGRVKVNGMVTTRLGVMADPATDEITVDGRPLPDPCAPRVIMLNKPAGYLSTCRKSREHGRSVLELIPAERRLYPVGRLDRESTGLLLLTDDGNLALRLTHPRYASRKYYVIETVRSLTPAQIDLLRRGVLLDDGPARAVRVTVLDEQRIMVVVTEGRNRLIRRMLAAIGSRVTSLHRIRISSLELGHLPAGAWRDLTHDEVTRLSTGKRES